MNDDFLDRQPHEYCDISAAEVFCHCPTYDPLLYATFLIKTLNEENEKAKAKREKERMN